MGKEKKEKKEPEPQYYISATNIPTYNYKVYHMKPLEKILYFLLAFAGGIRSRDICLRRNRKGRIWRADRADMGIEYCNILCGGAVCGN